MPTASINSRRGFTAVELIVVLVLLAIFVGVTLVWVDRQRDEMLREEVRSILADLREGPRDGEVDLPEPVRRRLVHLLPDSADVLFAIVATEEENHETDFLVIRMAGYVLLKLWDDLPQEQIDSFFKTNGRASVRARPQYPEGITAYVGTGYYFVGGTLWHRDVGLTIQTVTRHTLDGQARVDGQPYREPFLYEGPRAGTGAIFTEDLALGVHTAQVATEYIITYQGRHVTKGTINSGPVTFEFVPASTPDHLAAPQDPKLDSQVRDALQLAEIREPKSKWAGLYDRSRNPQTSWRARGSRSEVALRLPVWDLNVPLPVDLAFEVEFHLLDAGEIHRGDSIVAVKDNKNLGYFSLRETRPFIEGREGEVPLRVVLKPSRGLALSNLNVTEYYNGPEITSEVLSIQIHRFNESEASPAVLSVRKIFKEFTGLDEPTMRVDAKKKVLARTGIDEQMFYKIEGMASLNPYRRENAVWGRLNIPAGDVTPALPFLIELLGDPAWVMPNGIAGKAAETLTYIGEPAIPPLVSALKHQNPDVRRRAASTLGTMSNKETREKMAPVVIDPLTEALNDEDAQVREAASLALQRFPEHRLAQD